MNIPGDTVQPQRSSAGLLGFNGELLESVTGNYLLGHGYRAYSTLLMRFLQPDSWSPFGRGGLNPYGYCVGDPLNQSDPTGHMPLNMWASFFRRGSLGAMPSYGGPSTRPAVGPVLSGRKRTHAQAFSSREQEPLALTNSARDMPLDLSAPPLDLSTPRITNPTQSPSATTSRMMTRSRSRHSPQPAPASSQQPIVEGDGEWFRLKIQNNDLEAITRYANIQGNRTPTLKKLTQVLLSNDRVRLAPQYLLTIKRINALERQATSNNDMDRIRFLNGLRDIVRN